MTNRPGKSVANGALPEFGHLRCLLTPVITLAFLVWQPEQWWLALAFAAATVLVDATAERSPAETRQPIPGGSAWRYDILLYAVFAIHWVNLFLGARLAGEAGWATVQVWVALHLIVQSSSLAVIAAHELVHRAGAGKQWMGRLLLCSIFYEHFRTAHLRGHHAGAGDDPSTALPGERFWPYLARNLPAQFSAAWRLDKARVLQGVLLEAGLAAAVLAAFGPQGFALLAVNAAMAFTIVHAVTYFQHWNPRREGGLRAAHTWDSPGRSNLFSLIGMARHGDHHLNPERPFHQLRHVADSPKLPRAFGGMVWLAVMDNDGFQRLMTEALNRLPESG